MKRGVIDLASGQVCLRNRNAILVTGFLEIDLVGGHAQHFIGNVAGQSESLADVHIRLEQNVDKAGNNAVYFFFLAKINQGVDIECVD